MASCDRSPTTDARSAQGPSGVWHFYASVPLGYAPESAFPGSDAVASAAKAACASAAAELDDANADTDATQWWFYPGEEGWDDGRRTASCWMYLI